MRHKIRRIHFVGIGGAGMSGIAEVLHTQGFQVQGSDLADGPAAARLRDLGVPVMIGHAAGHVAQADAIVVSTAVPADNPEVMMARARGIPVVPRAVMLAELMRLKQGIAIAGTHGKTTTTSLVASVLSEAGLDPTYVIGGKLLSAGVNARLGAGEWMVVEADESDASFLHLNPVLAVVTNIDADHMDTYGQSLERLDAAFVDFTRRLPFYGCAVICVDDARVRGIAPRITKPIIGYGLAEDAQVRAVDVQPEGTAMRFVVRREAFDLPDLPLRLNLAGLHNVRNALAAVAVAIELELPDPAVHRALDGFKGVGRRFQRHGPFVAPSGARFELVDDYGHHPAEIAAVIAAARGAFAGRRLVLAFQPHRYTRTRDLFEDFVEVMSQADAVLLTEVYAAGENVIQAADGRSLARALRVKGRVEPLFVGDVRELPQAIVDSVVDGDVVLCLGAGSIGQVPARLHDLLAAGASA
jgi:UDP-N-acetylmuramate--alanine ligase